jgi:hypothetical protein
MTFKHTLFSRHKLTTFIAAGRSRVRRLRSSKKSRWSRLGY